MIVDVVVLVAAAVRARVAEAVASVVMVFKVHVPIVGRTELVVELAGRAGRRAWYRPGRAPGELALLRFDVFT